MKFRKVKQVLIVSALVCSMSAVPVYAAPEGSIDSLEDEQSELKDQKNDADKRDGKSEQCKEKHLAFTQIRDYIPRHAVILDVFSG